MFVNLFRTQVMHQQFLEGRFKYVWSRINSVAAVPVPDMTYNVFGGTLNPAQLSLRTSRVLCTGKFWWPISHLHSVTAHCTADLHCLGDSRHCDDDTTQYVVTDNHACTWLLCIVVQWWLAVFFSDEIFTFTNTKKDKLFRSWPFPQGSIFMSAHDSKNRNFTLDDEWPSSKSFALLYCCIAWHAEDVSSCVKILCQHCLWRLMQFLYFDINELRWLETSEIIEFCWSAETCHISIILLCGMGWWETRVHRLRTLSACEHIDWAASKARRWDAEYHVFECKLNNVYESVCMCDESDVMSLARIMQTQLLTCLQHQHKRHQTTTMRGLASGHANVVSWRKMKRWTSAIFSAIR